MGHYYYHQEEQNLFLRMNGSMKYTSSAGFDRFLNKNLTDEISSVLVDLQNTEYIDSTNLGFIARIAEFLLSRRKNRLLILSTNENINEVLSSMGFEQVSTIISTSADDISYEEIPVKTASEKELLKLMVESHKKLIALNDENAEIFEDVIELMEKELES